MTKNRKHQVPKIILLVFLATILIILGFYLLPRGRKETVPASADLEPTKGAVLEGFVDCDPETEIVFSVTEQAQGNDYTRYDLCISASGTAELLKEQMDTGELTAYPRVDLVLKNIDLQQDLLALLEIATITDYQGQRAGSCFRATGVRYRGDYYYQETDFCLSEQNVTVRNSDLDFVALEDLINQNIE